ncbi:peroxiredoxin [Pollutimonas bauzanensis]|uniref:thioredoxin-dependent peroxiredoxin n=1 Tax=Pollutimonas bauzanensis TaxID=658167 RepID=A0A1M5WGP3_9BURK|nr:Peroxiredoxin [Pollutimonas bauzanensis]
MKFLRPASIASHTLIALACAVPPSAAYAQLKVGAPAPDFTLEATLGGNAFPFTLNEALEKGPVVLYFYPAAFTKGCTIEAHDFAEATDEYKQYGATVLGVSADKLDKLKEFSVDACRSKFAVGADPQAKVIKAYDANMAFKPNMANRISYVITPDHKIYYEYTSLDPDGHVANTMAAVKKWAASKP